MRNPNTISSVLEVWHAGMGGEEILGRNWDCFLQQEVTPRLEEIIDVLGEVKIVIQNITLDEYFWTAYYLLDSYFFLCEDLLAVVVLKGPQKE